MFLIEGENRACLVDTGYGIGNLREYVEGLTDKPVFVLNTHSHGDHAHGNGWFDEVYLNKADWETFLAGNQKERRFAWYQKKGFLENVPEEDFAPAFCGELKEACDGCEFDLGGLTLKCILVPGHTRGSIAVLLKEERIIIYGDAVGRRLGLLSPDHPVSMCLEGLKNLKQYDGSYDLIWRSHNGLTVPLDILDNVIECCQDILKGTDARMATKKGIRECYCAREIDENQARIDGKQGNVFYILENAR